MPTVTPEILARAAVLGAAGGALSVTRHPVAVRRLGLTVAGLAGGAVAWAAATGRFPGEEPPRPATEDGGEGGSLRPLPVAGALAAGAGTFVVLAAVSEVGVRAQAGLERWADRTTGHPREAVALVTAASSILIDLAEQRLDPAG